MNDWVEKNYMEITLREGFINNYKQDDQTYPDTRIQLYFPPKNCHDFFYYYFFFNMSKF